MLSNLISDHKPVPLPFYVSPSVDRGGGHIGLHRFAQCVCPWSVRPADNNLLAIKLLAAGGRHLQVLFTKNGDPYSF